MMHHPINRRFLGIFALAASLSMLSAAPITPASQVIIDASFNNTADGVLEDFSLLSNAIGNPAWDNATGQASMSIDEASTGTVGCVSDGFFDGSQYSAITASFVIESITDPDGHPTQNGHWVGLTGNNSELWNNSEAAGGADGWALGIRYLEGDVNFVYDNAGGNEVIISLLGSYDLASLQDGYTVDFRFDAAGWEVCLTGITGSVDANGSWPAGFNYTTLTSDSTVFASMAYQQANEAGTIVDLASISVNGDPLAPNFLNPTAIFTTNAQSPAVTGASSVNSGDSSADSDFYIRERLNAGQTDRRISSYLNFDVSSLTVADVNDPAFLVLFTADYEFQLNNVNSTPATLGRVTNSAWDGTTTFPLHTWGIANAADKTTLIDNIAALAPTTSVSADVTSIVQGWVNGTTNNYGLGVFIDQNTSNAAGFSNARLLIGGILDSDNDEMPDDYELANELDPNDPADAALDNDADGGADGLTNLEEYIEGTDPQDSDSDDDGLLDGQEVDGTLNPYQTATPGVAATTAPGLETDPLVADSDSDGLSDFEELDNSNGSITNPRTGDTDNDSLPDTFEIAGGLDPTDSTGDQGGTGDPDMDDLDNLEEQVAGTDPNDPDSDDDTLKDGAEVKTHFTDPLDPDSDNDRLADFYEVNELGTDPNDADSDDDFLNDFAEVLIFRTNPKLADSDSDTFNDGTELAALSNPLDGTITPNGQDGDEDGLLDSFETSSFGNLDSTGLDDNDGDRFPNIVEQAFGSLPNDAKSLPGLEFDSSLDLSFRRQLVAGVGYELLVSLDLKSWQPFLGFLTENAATPVDSNFEEAHFQVATDDERMFMKVRPHTEITSRPNIILFYTDDQGYGDMGANNPGTKFPTPNHDLLAAQGINFTDGHCSDTVCTPSRYGLLTGRYSWRTTLKTNVIGADDPALIPDTRMTLASLLKSQGYATAMVGKWHLGMDIPGTNGNRNFAQPIDDMPLDVGFDYFYGLPASMNFGYLAWIEGRFTAVNPTQFTSKKPNNLPGVFNDFRFTPPYDQTRGVEAAPDFDDVLCLTRFTDKAIEWMEGRVEDAHEGKPFFIYIPYTSPHKPVIPRDDFLGLSGAGAYGDFMMETDYHIGNVLKFLDESGLANNTMVIMTSDNGPESTYTSRVNTYGHDSAGIYRGGKRDIYEGGHRVPLVVRWPAGIKSPGRTWNKPVCQTDFLATFAEMLDFTLDDHSGEDSVSFYDVLRDNTANPTRTPMAHHSFEGRFAVREGDWKLIMPHEGSGYELYNLATDPTETTNALSANPLIKDDLEAKVTEIVTSGRSTPGADVGNDTGWWDDLEWINPADY